MIQPSDAVRTFTRAELRIRPAQPEDRLAIEAIAAQTWDGEDYLPRVINQWLSDPSGGFYVADLHDQVIGVAKLTRFDDGEWWMEGLRVDPAFHGQGIARILHHFVINQAHWRGSGVLRFSTGSDNEATFKLARESAFKLGAKFVHYFAGALDEPLQGLRRLSFDDLPRVVDWLEGSERFALAQRSMEHDWTFHLITPEKLGKRLAAGLVYGWPLGEDRALLGGVALLNPTGKERFAGDPSLKIAYFDAADSELAAAARDLRRLATGLHHDTVELKPVQQPTLIAALESAGYGQDWDGELCLFARDVILTLRAQVQNED
ncbi:MAG: GNAT family N-acetyltransferase [Chloroflexi bacterium]|nr:GNAT family N-acetyltransferase [Chloroflexota bacterium]